MMTPTMSCEPVVTNGWMPDFSLWAWTAWEEVMVQMGWWSTSTTTQRPRPTTLETIRDIVNRDMAQTNPADVVEVLHQLLANARDLLRRQRLLNEALEEMLLWLPPTEDAPVLNGRAVAHSIEAAVIEEAGYGNGTSMSERSYTVDAPAVLLQPDLPATLQDVSRALPHLSRSSIAGLRRRTWRTHIADLHAREGVEVPSSSDEGINLVTETFTDLFLVQCTPGSEVTVPVGCPPFPVAPRRGAHPHRRRLHAARPCPTFCTRTSNLVPASPTWIQWEERTRRSSSSPTTPATRRRRSTAAARARHGDRERSRSRDVSGSPS